MSDGQRVPIWSGSGGPFGGSGSRFDKFQWGYNSDSRAATFANRYRSNENLTYTYDHDSQLTSAAAGL